MRIIDPQVTILPFDAKLMLLNLERAARLCYKSEGKVGLTPNLEFLRNKIDMGHESIIEHEKISVIIVCDRGITHEIVRHRIAAYSQESTRYCNYSGDRFGGEITVIKPFFFEEDTESYDIWRHGCMASEEAYMCLLNMGRSPQEARSVLPNSLKTEIFVTFNIREWRHFFKLRTAPAAHPQMRQIAIPLLQRFQKIVPVMFDDLQSDYNVSSPAKIIVEEW